MITHVMEDTRDFCANCGLSSEVIEEHAAHCGQKWARRGHVLRWLETGEVKHCNSINEAKRFSRNAQKASLGLGRGEMRAIA